MMLSSCHLESLDSQMRAYELRTIEDSHGEEEACHDIGCVEEE